LNDWVATVERQGKPRNSFERERLTAAAMNLDERHERLAKLLEDDSNAS
jgi:hypothetical protein